MDARDYCNIYKPMSEYKFPGGYMKPAKGQLAEANTLFKPYIFYKEGKHKRTLWTSCCGRSEVEWEEHRRTETEETFLISYGNHNHVAICPFCGRKAKLKDVGRIRGRKTLEEHVPVVFVNEKNGDLYAVGAWASKNYKGDLAEPPAYKITSFYHFSLKKNEADTIRFYIYGNSEKLTLSGKYDPQNHIVDEPFKEGIVRIPYNVIGIERIDESDFKYCGYKEYWKRPQHMLFMRYLAAYCIWPRNIEMLAKSGLSELIDFLIDGRKKNADLIKWGVDNPKDAFGLDGQEFKEFLQHKNLDVLRLYKKFRKAEMRTSQEDCHKIENWLGRYAQDCTKLWIKYRIKPMHGLHYLKAQEHTACYGAYFDIGQAAQLWIDYIKMCEYLKYDLTNGTVLLPKELELKHNEATVEQQRLLEIEEEKKDKEKMKIFKERFNEWSERYNFELDGLRVSVAPDRKSILQEGKALQHCVGGYASRHMDGKLTILFLRKVDEPDTPYITIEMQGNTMIQAHGLKNDCGGIPPRTKHRYFFDTWLAWIRAGSKRDEEGKPLIQILVGTA